MMTSRSIILIGGPDSGKTNYVGRLWASLKKRTGKLQPVGMPTNIEYVNGAVEHLMKSSFAPRSDRNLETGRRGFSVGVRCSVDGPLTELVVPDISGELWKNAIKDSELPAGWLNELKSASGAMLFVRVHSDLNVQPPDWVTARRLLEMYGEEAEPELPTQVLLCELLRHLNTLLIDREDGGAPRVALVVSAWDRLDQERRAAGPVEFLRREFPLLAGRLWDTDRLEIRVFGLSILDGDLDDDEAFREGTRGKDIAEMGSVVIIDDVGKSHIVKDVTLPIAWLIGE